MKKVLFSFLSVLLIFLFTGCGENVSNEAVAQTTSVTTSNDNTADIIGNGDVDIQILSVSSDSASHVNVDIAIKNISNKIVSVSPDLFCLKLSNNETANWSISHTSYPFTAQPKLLPGAIIKGTLSFDAIPTFATTLMVKKDMDIYSNDYILIDISLDEEITSDLALEPEIDYSIIEGATSASINDKVSLLDSDCTVSVSDFSIIENSEVVPPIGSNKNLRVDYSFNSNSSDAIIGAFLDIYVLDDKSGVMVRQGITQLFDDELWVFTLGGNGETDVDGYMCYEVSSNNDYSVIINSSATDLTVIPLN